MVSSCVRVCTANLHKWPIFNVVNERHRFCNTTQLQTDVSLMIRTCTSTALKCPLPTRLPRLWRCRCLVTIAMTSVFTKLFLNMYKVIQNDCRGFNDLSHTIHFRQEYMHFLFNRTTLQVFVTYLTGKPDPSRNPIERNHMELHLENEVARRVASDHHRSHARSIAAVKAGLKII